MNIQHSNQNKLTLFFRKHIGSKQFLKNTFKMGFPVYVTAMLFVLVSVVDSLMVAPLGTDKLAAIGAASQLNTFSYVLMTTIAAAGFIYFTQHHGKEKTSWNTRSSLTTGMYFTTFITIILVVFVQFFARELVSIFVSREEIIEPAIEYVKIISIGWIPYAIIITIVRSLIRSGKTKISLFVGITSILCNVLLNYLFINGIGVPMLGVKGVALSTLLSKVIELGVCVSVVLILRLPEYKSFGSPFLVSTKFIKKILSKFWLVLQKLIWTSTLMIQFALIATKGGDSVAIMGVVYVISSLLARPHRSFEAIVNYYVGRPLGKGDLKQAKKMSIQITKTSTFFSFGYMLLFFALSYGIVLGYSSDAGIEFSSQEIQRFILYSVFIFTSMYFFSLWERVWASCLAAGGRVISVFIGESIALTIGVLTTYFLVKYSTLHYTEIFYCTIAVKTFKTISAGFLFFKFNWVKNLTGLEVRHPHIQKFIDIFKNKNKQN